MSDSGRRGCEHGFEGFCHACKAAEISMLREQLAAAEKLISEWRSQERMPAPYHDAGATYGHCADALEAALAAGGNADG